LWLSQTAPGKASTTQYGVLSMAICVDASNYAALKTVKAYIVPAMTFGVSP
jgi:hypothetical protein